MREPLRFAGRVVGATVSRTAHAWFVALLVETDDQLRRTESQRAVGVDVGINALAVLSTGESIEGPKALEGLISRLRRLSRAHSRKVKGSANRKKSAQRLARLHWRIANVRSDALHKLTHRLTRDYAWVAIEDLNVAGMLRNRCLARRLADAAFGEFRRQLTYKSAQRGVQLAVVDRFYPSSKTCSACGAVNRALALAERSWTCPACGERHQRDHNAAVNILAESIRAAQLDIPEESDQATAGAAGIACGEEGADAHRKMCVKPASMKQEVQAKPGHVAKLCLTAQCSTPY
jgi:putative transposase